MAGGQKKVSKVLFAEETVDAAGSEFVSGSASLPQPIWRFVGRPCPVLSLLAPRRHRNVRAELEFVGLDWRVLRDLAGYGEEAGSGFVRMWGFGDACNKVAADQRERGLLAAASLGEEIVAVHGVHCLEEARDRLAEGRASQMAVLDGMF